MYYERMVASNMGFESKFTDAQLGLCPQGECDSEMPEVLPAKIQAAGDVKHEIMRQRLLGERHKRKGLKEKLERLRAEQRLVVV
jgi:hypothetical protein